MPGIYEELRRRGFVYQCTDEEAVERLLSGGPVTFYVGFDPTADSLHVGSLIPILAMMHMQAAGHRAIVLIGGGTALVGDPSGKTQMRTMLTRKQVEENAASIAAQLAHFIRIDGTSGLLLDNASWLCNLGYIDFLREIGRHFSVNRMLNAESYRSRLETGLSFLEFNYMLLQSYDFMKLYREYGAVLQMGGQDQWGNIVAGTDLIRRVASGQAYGLTFPLLTDASGNKLGKTVAGAVWLSADKTAPFDFYQYWRNTNDRDVERFLKLFTFLPVEECERLGRLEPPLLNRAKEILGYEVTRLVHGPEVAANVWISATKQFPPADPQGLVPTSSSLVSLVSASAEALPSCEISFTEAARGIPVIDLFVRTGLARSRSEARRLIRQGGASLNNAPIREETLVLNEAALLSSPVLKAGKKRMARVVVKSD